MRASLAAICLTHWSNAARSSGLTGGTEDSCGGRALARRAIDSSCASAVRAYSSRRACSAKKSTAISTPNSRARKVSANFQKRLCRTSFEQVPCTADRLQVNRILRVAFDFFAQAADVSGHAARRDEAIGAPNSIEKLVTRENTIGPRSKVIEQPEFERAERNGLAGMTDTIRRRIDGQLADLNGAGRVRRGLRSAEQRLDARQQFARAERLGDVIGSPHLQPHDAIGFFAPRGEHQGGETIQRVVPANFPAEIEARNLGAHEVEKQQIRGRFLQAREAAGAVGGCLHLESFICQVVANQFDDIAVIFDD